MIAVVMPEDEFVTLCKKQCLARRKQYGNDSCDERDGMCGECVSDALARAPKKYRVPDEVALRHDPLPG